MALLVWAVASGSASVSAQSDSSPTLYRLNQESIYQKGCFPPCLCPVQIRAPFKGTFVLTPTGFDGLFNSYAVTEVNWIIPINGKDTIVTGRGTYKIGGEFALQQQLSLKLRIGGSKVQHFDSGLVTSPVPFPNINATISINGETCVDTVFQVSASPVPLDQIRPYRLGSRSSFQQGCFGPCQCAMGPLDPIVGRFALVPLDATPLSSEFAVVNVRWRVADPAGSIRVRGFGTYKISGEVAAEHQLRLLLAVGNQDAVHFDSGLVPGGGNFPDIDIRISISRATCFDIMIDVNAAPRR
jgi:hypothetical protein